MAKSKAQYACQSCGALSPKWQGQCPSCEEWNTLVETIVAAPNKAQKSSLGYSGSQAVIQKLGEVTVSESTRIKSHIQEFDRVLGGGIVAGSVTLIGGDPGIGKSSILLQITAVLSQSHKVLYVTGEESIEQVALRARRMNLPCDDLMVMCQTDVEVIVQYIQANRPAVVVIDSIQTMQHPELTSAAGGVAQVRESAAYITQVAKQHHTAVFFVGHVTKSGEVAGPRVLEHIVDAVVFIEGQSDGRYRMMRALKNRFGAVNELGVFAMTDQGMKEIKNPSAMFLSRGKETLSGSVVIAIWEGTRPLLVEVQALVNDNGFGQPRRHAVGIDQNRLVMLIAIMQRHLGIQLNDSDVFINVVGGIRIAETGIDLAIIAAILSSLYNKAIPHDWIIMGEVGLSGEVRPVPYGLERVNEAAKHGFTKAIVPSHNTPKKGHKHNMDICGLDELRQLRDLI